MLQRSMGTSPKKNVLKSATVSIGSSDEISCNKENRMGTVDTNKKYLANMNVSDVSCRIGWLVISGSYSNV